MPTKHSLESTSFPSPRAVRILCAILCLFFPLSLHAASDPPAKTPAKVTEKKDSDPKEVLIFKNGDQLTGKLLNSTGTEVKFESDMAGEVTVALNKIKELKSSRQFAIVPKDIKDSRNSAMVPQGRINIKDDAIVVVPLPADSSTTPAVTPKADEAKPAEVPPATPATPLPPQNQQAKIAPPATPAEGRKEVAAPQVGFIVDDHTYQQEIHKKIEWKEGWDGHITTASTMVFATQNSYLFLVNVALQRSVPTVSWLDPKLRTKIDYTQSAGQTSQIGTPTTKTNIFHASAERDKYVTPRRYFLVQTSFDHDSTQGLDLQQIYGAGIGATFFKQEHSEFDVTADLHYESQAFNSTADVSTLNRHLVGTSWTEAYTRKFGKLQFDEKFLANTAWNDESAFSASGTTSIRMAIYKKLAFSLSVIDNFQNDPQVGYNKNSFQFATGFALSLH